MNKCFCFVVFAVFTIIHFNCAGLKPKPYLGSNIPSIRVLLLEGNDFQLKLLGRYVLSDKGRSSHRLPGHKTLTVRTSNDFGAIDIFQDGKRISSGKNISIVAKERSGQFQIRNGKYKGDLHFQLKDKQIQVINITDVESYLKGVVPAEIGKLGEKEVEALKAQAVASRTYALKKLEQNGKQASRKEYDILAGVGDQVYAGISKQNKWADFAVDNTSGEVAVYKNSLIYAFFHSTCGGRTEYGKNVFSSVNVPYLQGIADNFGSDDFCQISPHHRWVESFSFHDIEKSIKTYYNGNENIAHNNSITDITVKKRFKSGRIAELDLIFGSKSNTLTLRGDQLRRIIRKENGIILRSNLFRIAKYGSKGNPAGFMLIGAGNGHGVGMCQWGAIGMARSGFDYRQILYHYYRGIKVKKLY